MKRAPMKRLAKLAKAIDSSHRAHKRGEAQFRDLIADLEKEYFAVEEQLIITSGVLQKGSFVLNAFDLMSTLDSVTLKGDFGEFPELRNILAENHIPRLDPLTPGLRAYENLGMHLGISNDFNHFFIYTNRGNVVKLAKELKLRIHFIGRELLLGIAIPRALSIIQQLSNLENAIISQKIQENPIVPDEEVIDKTSKKPRKPRKHEKKSGFDDNSFAISQEI